MSLGDAGGDGRASESPCRATRSPKRSPHKGASTQNGRKVNAETTAKPAAMDSAPGCADNRLGKNIVAKDGAQQALEPLRITVPASGVHYAFEKLYANQSDHDARFSVPAVVGGQKPQNG